MNIEKQNKLLKIIIVLLSIGVVIQIVRLILLLIELAQAV